MRIKRLSALLLSALLITSPIGYMTVMQRVIEYANAEHTLGKVKA